jgi:uncharacterized protein
VNPGGLWLAKDGLPRTPWRILLFLAIALVASVIVQALLFPVFERIDREASQPLIFAATVVGLLIAHWLVVRKVDGLDWSFVGLHRAALDARLIAGSTLLGALAIGLPVLALFAIGWLRMEPSYEGSLLGAAAWALIVLLPAAFAEELLLRGYCFSVLVQRWGRVAALLVTSIIFGLLHIPNPGSSPLPIVMVVLAGVLLGGVMIATGSLYAATAAHLAWNWVMAAVVHSPVSGLGMRTPGYRLQDAGPTWATGGSWGPEGGVFAGAGMLLAMLLIHKWYRRREARAQTTVTMTGPLGGEGE